MSSHQCLRWWCLGRLRRSGDWHFHGRTWCFRWRDRYWRSKMVDPARFTCACLPRKAENERIVSHPCIFVWKKPRWRGTITATWMTSEPRQLYDTSLSWGYDDQRKVTLWSSSKVMTNIRNLFQSYSNQATKINTLTTLCLWSQVHNENIWSPVSQTLPGIIVVSR